MIGAEICRRARYPYLGVATAIVAIGLVACSTHRAPVGDPYTTFGHPQWVKIVGYTGNAMEPFISPDGRYLFFNSSNEAPTTELHYAERVDDVTFKHMGTIGGLNAPGSVAAVASMDRNGEFYFVSTRSYSETLSTLSVGHFSNGSVSDVRLVEGVSKHRPGAVNFDGAISPDGTTLYFVDGVYNGGPIPRSAEIAIAWRVQGDVFRRLPNSAALMQNVNALTLVYAPCISKSGLELFFTSLRGLQPRIYRASRANIDEPFGVPQPVSAAAGDVVEAPALSPDERSLYYHVRVAGAFVIYRVTRP